MAGPLQILRKLVNSVKDEHSNGTYVVIPTPAATTFAITPAVVTAGADFATNGTTDEIIAATTEDLWIDGVFITNAATTTNTIEVDIGVGTAASETWLATFHNKTGVGVAAPQTIFNVISPPIFVRSGERIAQRARGEGATAVSTVLFCRTNLNA